MRLAPLTSIRVVRRKLGAQAYHAPSVTIGIRREDPLRVWERRCPLTPDAVEQLVEEEDVNVIVQPCERRVFPIDKFVKAGAKIHPTLSPAHITIGIKETPLNELLTDSVPIAGSTQPVARTHVMFSHTIKGQSYNMPLLDRFLTPSDSNTPNHLLPTLMDYELLVDSDGKRTIGFGWHAGVAGALEGLASSALLHLEHGVATPFLQTPRPYTSTLSGLRKAVRNIGKTISSDGTSRALGPFVIGVTGSGQVTRGVLSLLSELPTKFVSVEELPDLVADPHTPLNKIYVVHATPEKYLTRRNGSAYDRADYYANPTEYESNFYKTVAPYLTILMNGVGWRAPYPRLMTNEQLFAALEEVQVIRERLIAQRPGTGHDVMKARCLSFADISCDIGGGLEFLPRESTLTEPYFHHRPPGMPSHLPTIQIMAVDILPTSLPLDASKSFSEKLVPYLRTLVKRYRNPELSTSTLVEKSKKRKEDEDLKGRNLDEELDRAMIASRGELMGKNKWLVEPLGTWRQLVKESAEKAPKREQFTMRDVSSVMSDSDSDALSVGNDVVDARTVEGGEQNVVRNGLEKKVLLLGSGMVAKPVVDELCSRENVRLVVASNDAKNNEVLTRRHQHANGVLIDMRNVDQVERLVSEADIVISLLPVPFHPSVAELCIKHKKNMVTASYISPEMKALHDRAVDSDIVILNEIGLDPGIDHCSTLSILSDLQSQNKKPVSYISFCGGLPAPECADVPLGYKFSWSPQGVLKAALNGARFRLNGQDVEIPGERLMKDRFSPLDISPVLKLEGLANRDSFPYAATYGLGQKDELRTLLRGTIRYTGFADVLQSFKDIGLLNSSSPLTTSAWPTLAMSSLEAHIDTPIRDEASFLSALRDIVDPSSYNETIQALDFLGLLPSSAANSALLPLPPTGGLTPIDLFTRVLAHKLCYGPNERDMVLMHHEIISRPISSNFSPDSVSDFHPDEEVHVSSLQVYGTPEVSAMSRTVGLPVAFAALKVLDGGVTMRGVQGPTEKGLWKHVLGCLSDAGIKMKEMVWKGEQANAKRMFKPLEQNVNQGGAKRMVRARAMA